jgi:hypothetical protein
VVFCRPELSHECPDETAIEPDFRKIGNARCCVGSALEKPSRRSAKRRVAARVRRLPLPRQRRPAAHDPGTGIVAAAADGVPVLPFAEDCDGERESRRVHVLAVRGVR